MIAVFDTLKAQLRARVPQLKLVATWNNQLVNEAQERPANLAMPAVYLEILGVKATTISAGIQHGEGLLRVRHCSKALRESDLASHALEANTYLALQNFSGGPLLIGLDRRSIYPDTNHAAVEMVISEYFIKYVDDAYFNARFQLHPARVKTEAATS
jgi:hypothetical protein